MKKNKFNKIVVHNGVFHADDVLCVSFAQEYLGIKEYERVNDASAGILDESVLVADIGMFNDGISNFDHHQYDGGDCSFALLIKAFKPLWLEDVEFAAFVKKVSKQDTQGIHNDFSDAVKSFNPQWDECGRTSDEAFAEAVEFAKMYLKRIVRNIDANVKADAYAKEIEVVNGVAISDCWFPWQGRVSCGYFISPSNRGGWNIVTADSNSKPLPAEWLEEEPEGCTFVHKGRWIASFNSKEMAMKAMGLIGDPIAWAVRRQSQWSDVDAGLLEDYDMIWYFKEYKNAVGKVNAFMKEEDLSYLKKKEGEDCWYWSDHGGWADRWEAISIEPIYPED